MISDDSAAPGDGANGTDGGLADGGPADGPPPDDGVLPDDRTLLAECRVETFRSGGPGGQHQNTTDSGVRLTHLPTGISVTARDSRSQHRNRRKALVRLRTALEDRARPETPRVPTKVPKSQKRKRLEGKRRRSEVKRARRKPDIEE